MYSKELRKPSIARPIALSRDVRSPTRSLLFGLKVSTLWRAVVTLWIGFCFGLTIPGDKLPTKSLFQQFLWVDLDNPNKGGSHGQDACAQHRDLFQELLFPLLLLVNLVGQLGNLEPLVQLGKLLQLVLLQSLIVLGIMGSKSNC